MSPPVRVLIAEDEEPIRLALTTIVRKNLGCDEVVGCPHGGAAWEKLQAEPYALVISDWNMPEKSGYELLQAMRADARTRDIPLLLLTARSDKSSVIEAIQAGVSDYITKPFDKDMLIQKARKLLARTGAVSAAPAAAPADANSLIDDVTRRLRNNEITLPVLPDLARKVEVLLAREDVELDELVQMIQTDPGITSRLLAIANSAHYRGSSKIKTLDKAISRIGLKMTENYVLALSKRSLFRIEAKPFETLLARLWRHSLATAEAARLLAAKLGLKDVDGYYTMGLLHDIGKLVLIQILAELVKRRPDIAEADMLETLHRLHGEFGATLLEHWHFPVEMRQVARHHEDLSIVANVTTAMLVVALANLIAQRAGYCTGEPPAELPDLFKLAQRLQLGNSAVSEVVEQVRASVGALKDVL